MVKLNTGRIDQMLHEETGKKEEPIRSASACQILKLPKAMLIDEEIEEYG